MNKIKVLAVVGPTASGKSDLAVALCRRFNGEVVSADSMQIYKGMDIATAKPTADEMQGICHHMLDFLETDRQYSVAQYQTDAADCISKICGKGKLPVVSGGTGLYIDTLLNNVRLSEESFKQDLRSELAQRCKTEGAETLLSELAGIDPEYAAKLHPNNEKRIIRALEVWHSTGKTVTEQNEASHRESPYEVLYIGLDAENRDYLYDRINRRVDLMLENGLENEAREFFNRENSATSAQAIGYKELKPYLDGELSLNEAVENLKRATRRYAKRQLTWFRRNTCINWLYIDKYESKERLFDAAFNIAEVFLNGGEMPNEKT